MAPYFARSLRARTMLSSAAGLAMAVVGISTARADVSGFGGNGVGWNIQSNGTGYTAGHPSATGDVLTLTDGANNEAGSAWFTTVQDVTNFTANFTYNDVGGSGADGIGFVLQNKGQTTVGAPGGSLGYGGITSSAALNLSVFNGPGHFGFASGGIANSYTGVPAPVSLYVANMPTNVTFSYVPLANVGVATATFTQGANSFTKSTVFNIPGSIGANTATVGFTGGTGSLTSTQQISNFTYTAGTASVPATYNVLQRTDAIVPLSATTAGGGNSIAAIADYPPVEAVANVLDLNGQTAYMNTNNTGTNDGLAVTPKIGPTIVHGFQFVGADNRHPDRDPLTITLEGSNDPNALTLGDSNWTSLYTGISGLTARTGSSGFGNEVDFTNGTPYLSYRLLATSVRGPGQNSVEFGDVELLGTIAPEPASLGLMSLGVLGLLTRRRRA